MAVACKRFMAYSNAKFFALPGYNTARAVIFKT